MQSKTWGGTRLVRVAVVYKHTKYDLKLDRKVTRIMGDSGTEKPFDIDKQKKHKEK